MNLRKFKILKLRELKDKSRRAEVGPSFNLLYLLLELGCKGNEKYVVVMFPTYFTTSEVHKLKYPFEVRFLISEQLSYSSALTVVVWLAIFQFFSSENVTTEFVKWTTVYVK